MSGAVSWLADALALAVREAQRQGLMYSDPVEARRAEALHLMGAVHYLLTSPNLRPRHPDAVAVVEALRRRFSADVETRIMGEGARDAASRE